MEGLVTGQRGRLTRPARFMLSPFSPNFSEEICKKSRYHSINEVKSMLASVA
jgi:hypothetical protein